MASNRSPVYPFFFILSALFLLLYVFVTVTGRHEWGGWILMIVFSCMAIGVRGYTFVKGLSYPIMMLAAFSVAMYYPQYFTSIGSIKLRTLIIPLLQLIMFGMGTELSLKDFARIARVPKGLVLGIICHYTVMPLVGFGLTYVFDFPSEIAAGIILIGCCPSGLASNVMSYLARANLALSVSVTAASTLLAPVLTPLLMEVLAGQYVDIHFWDMLWDITKIVILPIVAGLLFNYLVHGKFKWLDKAMPYVSMVSIGLILVVITAAGRNSLLEVGVLLIVATLIHNVAGYFLGYWSARILKFAEKDSRTISLEVGMQNAGLATGLADAMKMLSTVGLAAAIFGPLMNVTGSLLASWWHNRVPKD